MKKNKFYFFLFFLFFFSKTLASENINFLTLKNNEVNLRQGPSFEYPIKLIYKKKYLPLIITDKSENWRKTINIKNNSIIYKKPTIFSKPIAKLKTGRLILIKKCKIKWCKITSGKYSGWIEKNYLWGKIK